MTRHRRQSYTTDRVELTGKQLVTLARLFASTSKADSWHWQLMQTRGSYTHLYAHLINTTGKVEATWHIARDGAAQALGQMDPLPYVHD